MLTFKALSDQVVIDLKNLLNKNITQCWILTCDLDLVNIAAKCTIYHCTKKPFTVNGCFTLTTSTLWHH